MNDQVRMMLAVGNICTQWAYLESQLAIGIWSLLNINADNGKIVTGGLSITARASMILALTEGKKGDQTLSRTTRVILKRLREGVLDRRNEAVHGLVKSDPRGLSPEIETHRGKNRTPKPIGPTDFEELATEIIALSTTMDEALTKLKIVHSQSGEYLGPTSSP